MSSSLQLAAVWRRPTPGRRFLAAWLLLGAVALSTSAPATTPRAAAKVEFEKAQIHYKLGHFQEALEGYSRAYELYPAPAFLFNMGQCQKNLKNYERAIFFFEGYLRDEKNRSNRALAEELVAESRAEIEKQTSSPAPLYQAPGASSLSSNGDRAGAQRPPVFAPPVVPSDAFARPVIGEHRAAINTAPEKPARVTRAWWFWTAIGAGVLAATGGILYLSSGGTTFVPPSGTIGTLDRR